MAWKWFSRIRHYNEKKLAIVKSAESLVLLERGCRAIPYDGAAASVYLSDRFERRDQ